MSTVKDLNIRRNATFRQPFIFANPDPTFVHIESWERTTPIKLTATAHGIPDGWPIWVERVERGCQLERPRPKNPRMASVPDADHVVFPEIDGYGVTAVGGVIVYHLPWDLTEVSAKMTFIDVNGLAVLELTETSGLIVDPQGKISIDLSPAATGALDWDSATYELDITFNDGSVSNFQLGSAMVTGQINV